MINGSESLANLYRNTLLENVIPFWLHHSEDTKCGGYFTSLDRCGNVYDTDKFIWLQGRQVWMFSYIYSHIQENSDWIQMARKGIRFLEKYGRHASGDFYFSIDRFGTPLIQPYNIFSDCFGAMAYYQFGTAIQDQKYIDESIAIFRNILRRRNNPKGIYDKSTGQRPCIDFALPMILSNLAILLDVPSIGFEREKLVEDCKKIIFEQFYNKETGLIHEYVRPDGRKLDTFNGRLINPGHVLEAMWFMIHIGEHLDDQPLIDESIRIGMRHLEYGWDRECGGIFYFMDCMNKPQEKLEWDQKLWWVHIEALIFLTTALKHSRIPELTMWFQKVHDYTWSHFPDPDYGEWFGYLSREGNPRIDAKGGKWKGCFHLPRGLLYCWKNLEAS